MKFVTVSSGERETLGIVATHGIVLVETINFALEKNWSTDLFGLLQNGEWEAFLCWYDELGEESIQSLETVPNEKVKYAPLYRHPRKIWGVGFNYVANDEELIAVDRKIEPVGFMKPDTSLIGYGDAIVIPAQSNRTIAEAELAIVIGRPCKNVEESDATTYIAGYTTVFDMGADDIHSQNPRYLTRSKSFDTFFSFGPELLTLDEINDFANLTVSTIRNGEVVASKCAALMRYQPEFIVSFHSRFMTLLPGDIIMTGTPGAAVIRSGDRIECRVDGFAALMNVVS